MKRNRVVGLDRLRGIAVLGMIAVHGVDALAISPDLSVPIDRMLDIAAGFVAPGFFLLAGYFSTATTSGHVDRRPSRSVRRGVGLILAGLWLNLPEGTLSRSMDLTIDQFLAGFLDGDALVCIGVGILLTAFLRELCATRIVASSIALGIAIALAAVAPLVESSDQVLSSLIGPAATLPLDAFVPFVLLGGAIGFRVPITSVRNLVRYVPGWLLLGCGVLFVCASVLDALGVGTLWDGGIPSLLFRTAGVCGIAAGIVWFSDLDGTERRPGFVAHAGRLALPVYVIHLAILYGSPVTAGLAVLEPQVLALGEWIKISLLPLVAACAVALAKVWNVVGDRSRLLQRSVLAAAVLVWTVWFLVG